MIRIRTEIRDNLSPLFLSNCLDFISTLNIVAINAGKHSMGEIVWKGKCNFSQSCEVVVAFVKLKYNSPE